MNNLKTKYPISTFGEETQKEIIALVQGKINQAIQKRNSEILEWAENEPKRTNSQIIYPKELINFIKQ